VWLHSQGVVYGGVEAKAGVGEPAEDDGMSAPRHGIEVVVDLSEAARDVRGGRGVIVGGASADLAVTWVFI